MQKLLFNTNGPFHPQQILAKGCQYSTPSMVELQESNEHELWLSTTWLTINYHRTAQMMKMHNSHLTSELSTEHSIMDLGDICERYVCSFLDGLNSSCLRLNLTLMLYSYFKVGSKQKITFFHISNVDNLCHLLHVTIWIRKLHLERKKRCKA